MNTTLRNLIGFTLLAAIVLAMACQCFGQPAVSVVGESLQDANGWTQLPTLPAGARRVYVSSSDGNDADDGLSEANAKATVAAGVALIRSGFGDQLLFKRGDEWTITSQLEQVGGASASEPTVYGAYGSGVRPKITADSCNCFRKVGDIAHVYFLSLHLVGDGLVDESWSGVEFVTGQDTTGGILLEDLKLESFGLNAQFQAASGQEASDVTVRRCVIIDAKTGAGSHSQGIYSNRYRGVLIEENIFDHNGWADDWQDTAILSSGTTAAYTNGDTLTITAVRYGAYTAADEAETLDLELIDTNDASGTITSVTIAGDDIEVRADFTTGIASNTVATAIQNFNGGADFTCSSSGTANIVVADLGTQANILSGGHSENPTIFNHNVYLGNTALDVTFRRNIFARAAHMAMKVNTNYTTIIQHDNFICKSDRWGHVGNAAYSGGEFVGQHGSEIYVYNNVCVESEAIANARSNGPELKNTTSGYFRNNFIGQRATSEGTAGYPLAIPGVEDIDGGDNIGLNNVVIDGNVIWNFRGDIEFDEGPNYGDNGRTHDDNTWSNNIVGNTGDDDQPLLATELTDSGVMSYSGTNWWSTQSTATAWFDVSGSPVSTSTWQSTYEGTATFTNPTSGFTDPTRTSTTFATSHANSYANWDAWMADLQAQRQGDWDETIMAEAACDYIRAGFDMEEFTPSSVKKVLILQ